VVTHRSPLVTLVGLVAAFAIMFGVNLASSAPRNSYSASPSPSAAVSTPAASPTQAATTAASPAETPAPSPTATESAVDEDEFPNKIVYAGRTEDGSIAIAVAVLGQKAAAYLCDGSQVEAWLRGTVSDDVISLIGKNGQTLEAKLDGSALRGDIEIGDERFDFTLREAKPPAGLYRAKGSKTTIGWIILPDGSQVGIQTSGETSGPAPPLDPDNPEVTVDGESLQGEPVTGDLEI
jgi:hypothetical protein